MLADFERFEDARLPYGVIKRPNESKKLRGAGIFKQQAQPNALVQIT